MTYDLDLSGNYFNSSIHNWLYSFSHLQFLNLGLNNFQGTISNSIWNLTSAVNLDLSNNNLEGGIPTSLGSLCNLRSVDFPHVSSAQNISRVLDILSGCAVVWNFWI
jgi:hypothetical protein